MVARDGPQLPEGQERRASCKTMDSDELEQMARFLLDCREAIVLKQARRLRREIEGRLGVRN